MSIKRKDREVDGIKSYCGNHIPNDREVFLQAFESKCDIRTRHILHSCIATVFSSIFTVFIAEPTQIYRYLKSRHTLSVSAQMEWQSQSS